jgi:hypothetical protein
MCDWLFNTMISLTSLIGQMRHIDRMPAKAAEAAATIGHGARGRQIDTSVATSVAEAHSPASAAGSPHSRRAAPIMPGARLGRD